MSTKLISMPQIRKTSKFAFGAGGLLLVNNLVANNVPVDIRIIYAAEAASAAFLFRKDSMLGAAIGGAAIGALIEDFYDNNVAPEE